MADRNGWNPATQGSPIYHCSQAQPSVFRVRILIRDTRPISWLSQPFVSTHRTPAFPDLTDSVQSKQYLAPYLQAHLQIHLLVLKVYCSVLRLSSLIDHRTLPNRRGDRCCWVCCSYTLNLLHFRGRKEGDYWSNLMMQWAGVIIVDFIGLQYNDK